MVEVSESWLKTIKEEYRTMQDILFAIESWWYGEAQRFKDESSRITFTYRRFKELKDIIHSSGESMKNDG